MGSTIVIWIVAMFFAMNIGASGAAASMGVAYGSGAIKKRGLALLICGLGICLGSVIGGGEVIKTLGSGIVSEQMITIQIAMIILISASISLFLANITGIPLSTSEVTVGAIVGVGLAFHVLYIKTIMTIVLFWLLLPLVAFLLSYIVNKMIQALQAKFPNILKGRSLKVLTMLVVLTGFLEAFSAGTNNVANAVGPLVSTGLINIQEGSLIGGVFVAAGAIFLGANVMETNGKRITNLSLLQGGAISGIGAGLVIIASILGIPVPQTQVTTCSILGIGFSKDGAQIWRQPIFIRVIKTWVLSPFFSLVISYNLVKLLIHFDWSGISLLAGFALFVFIVEKWKPLRKTQAFSKEKIATSRKS